MPNPFEDLHVFRCQQKFAANFPGKKKNGFGEVLPFSVVLKGFLCSMKSKTRI